MKLKSAKAFVQEVAIILIGCFLTAFAVDCILIALLLLQVARFCDNEDACSNEIPRC